MTQRSTSEFTSRGAIVRIRLRNFMTYTDTELRPGPNLNMILGPNGTGKSTVVCAIIVGLAGNVSKTGRATDPSGFVKKGTDTAITEIELFNDRGQNYIIERKIMITRRDDRFDHKSEWKLNRKTSTVTQIRDLASKLSIKVDNLCQFLPQDSVTNFVKMDTRELLTSTLEAVGDNQLVEDHQKLVHHTRELHEKRQALSALRLQCQESEMATERLGKEVLQVQMRDQLKKDQALCNSKMYFVQYTEAKEKSKRVIDELENHREELKTIEGETEPFRRRIELYRTEEDKLVRAQMSSNDELRKNRRQVEEILSAVENRKISCQEEFGKFRSKQDCENKRGRDIRMKQQELESLECRLNDVRDVDYSNEIAEAEKSNSNMKKRLEECMRDKFRLDDDRKNCIRDIDKATSDHEAILQVSQKKANLLMQRSSGAYKAFDWLKRNENRFQDKIYAPMMCEINVRDVSMARIIEHAIPSQELLAFVCQNEHDLKLFTRLVNDHIGTRVNVILAPDKTLSEFEYDASQQMDISQRYGIKVTYLKDLIDAPEPIMRYLCGSYNFHRIPVANECTESQLKNLLNTCPKFYVGDNYYAVSKSRYDGQVMTVSDQVRNERFLLYHLDTRQLTKCLERLSALQKTQKSLDDQVVELAARHDNCKREWQITADRLRDLTRKHDEKKGLTTMIKNKRDEIESLRTERIDLEVERAKLQKSVNKINMEIIALLERYQENQITLSKVKRLHLTNNIMAKVAGFNHKTAKRKYNEAQIQTVRLRQEIKGLEIRSREYLRVLDERLKEAEKNCTGFKNGRLSSEMKRMFATIEENTVDELRLKVEKLNVQIRGIHLSSDVESEFRKQKQALKDRRERIATLEASIGELSDAAGGIKSTWRKKVDEVIRIVNTNYQDFMHKLCYDGKVELDYDHDNPDNFAAYGIKILVKYRDDEKLNPLSSTRQSGGERSVATMIYMLALQTKTTVPFRCVDEINQGMDKENERKVFELLVQTADSSSSQYFLVSPKLLKGLPYSEKMKIHIVFNGKKLGLAWNE